MIDLDLQIAQRAVKIAAVCLREAGVCRHDDVIKCRRMAPSKKDCYNCIERWLMLKAQREVLSKDKGAKK